MSVVQPVVGSLGTMLSPLLLALENKNTFTVFLQSLGWNVEVTAEAMTAIKNMVSISDELTSIIESVNAFGDETSAETIADVITMVDDIFAAIQGLQTVDVDDIAELIEPLNTQAFWRDFASDVPEYLIVTYLRIYIPIVHTLLVLGGVITETITDTMPPRTILRLNWTQLGSFLTDPPGHLASLYGWGDAFAHQRLVDRLALLGFALGLNSELYVPSAHILKKFYPRGGVPFNLRQLNLLFHDGLIEDMYVRAGVFLLAVPPTGESEVTGLYVGNLVEGDVAAVDLSPVAVEGQMEASGTVGIHLHPNQTLQFEGGAPESNFVLRIESTPEEPTILFGNSQTTRLELSGFEIEIGMQGTITDPEFILRATTSGAGLNLIITPGEGDAFVSELLGTNALAVGTDIEILWSSKTGFHIAGGAQLDITIPLNVTLFVITILEFHLSLAVATSGVIEAQADVDATALLGPFTLTVADIGVRASIVPSDDPTASGTFGGLEIDWAFKPPSGVGAALDFLGIVYGGGYIEHDPEKGEYSGMITVQLAMIGITATAIIVTQVPGNPGAWSMFVSINVDLGGIPLGFGFTLEKVGGLIGVHRTIDTAVFQAGVRTGLLDSILFPDDPIANAPQILSDIQSAFPTAQGSFVVGAMLQIGWGVPTLITANVGFIIQVPDIILMLVGQAQAILPAEEFPLIEVHFDVLGIIDLTAGTLSIDAGLRDSQIVGFVLTGQMALRASFLGQPSFLLAMGGFHPAFVPPDSFPTLARMGFGLSIGDWLNISLEVYLALTSNTVQFGAGLYLTAKFIGFSIEGGVEMNTLITFSPFQFHADISFFITVSAGSIELLGVLLTGHLSGPNPYFIRGQAQFKLFGLSQEVNIEESIGSKTTLDETDEIPLVADMVAALEESENWHAIDEGARIGAVILADVSDPDAEPTVHPGGSVEVTQRLAPLDVELEHYGNTEIDGQDNFEVDDVELGGGDIMWEFVEDWFAPAQFFEIANDEKLDAPSFEMMKAGLRFGDDDSDSVDFADALYDYEQIIHDPEFIDTNYPLKDKYTPDPAVFNTLGLQKQATVSSRPLVNRSASAAQVYTLKPVRYAIVDRTTLISGTGMPTRTMTHAEASQKVHSQTASHIVVTSGERVSQ